MLFYSMNGKSYTNTYLDIFSATSTSSKLMFRVVNGTNTLVNPYVIAYSNSNISLIKNNTTKITVSYKLITTVKDNDILEIFTSNIYYRIIISHITYDELYKETEQATFTEKVVEIIRWASRLEVLLPLVTSSIVAYLTRWWRLKR